MRTDRQQVAAWLQPEAIHLGVSLEDAHHALAFVAEAVASRRGLDPAPILRALERREQAGSTALGAGFALPHARIAGIARPLTVLVRAARPIDFLAPDHEPVSLILAILVPLQGDRDDHLELLALVAELFSQPRLRARMDTEADPAALARCLRDAIATTRGEHSPKHGVTRTPVTASAVAPHGRTRAAAAACWRRARAAVARLFGSQQTDPEADPTAPREHVPVPFCVSYGRAVFCFHLPASRPRRAREAADRPPR